MVGIKITDKPVKMTGVLSVLIQFDPSQRIKNFLESMPCYYYHKKKDVYEFPLTDLQELLDELCKMSDVILYMPEDYENDLFSNLSEESNIFYLDNTESFQNQIKSKFKDSLTQDEIYSFKEKPFNHQIDAINFGLEKEKFLLLDGCGLGKTNEIIWLAETLKARGKIEKCLIICAVNSLKQNWKKEIMKFSNESVRVLGEKKTRKGRIKYAKLTERLTEMSNPIDAFFVITNIENFRTKAGQKGLADVINNPKNPNHFGLIAIDEAHHGTSSSASQMKEVLSLYAPYKVAATGTLITNNPLSAYTALKFTDNDKATLTTYKQEYCEMGSDISDYQITGYKNLDLLREEIAHCSIRRTLDMVKKDIPPLQIDLELVEMDDKHADFYDAVKNGVKEEVNKVELNVSNLLALTTRLRQATACPSVLTENDVVSTKLERCAELASELLEQGEKVVILANFKESIYTLNRMLSQYKPLVCTGDIADGIVSENVDKFQESSDYNLFLGTTAKTGIGLTLNAAMYLIFVDIPWTWSDFEQGYSRVYRVNNTRPAFIKVLACQDTIDERVWDIVCVKKDLADFLVDGQMSESLAEKMKDVLHDLV